jgi:NDP-sugar pyrophosphorylase family protein
MKSSDYESCFIPIVLCAGFGTRLRPLTQYLPKVVCPLIQKPVAFLNIEMFFQAGFQKVHCNTHYLNVHVKTELILAAQYYGYDPTRIVFWHEEEILETGGGIVRIYQELVQQDPRNAHKNVVAVSGDIVAHFPFTSMFEAWERKTKHDYALMCTKSTPEIRQDATWVSADLKQILGYGMKSQGQKQMCQEEWQGAVARVFTTHQILGNELLRDAPLAKKSSIEIFYKKALLMKKNVLNIEFPEESYWFDVGTWEDYWKCICFFKNKIYSSLPSEYYFDGKIVNHAFVMPAALQKYVSLFQGRKILQSRNLTSEIIISFFHLERKNVLVPVVFEQSLDQTLEHFFSILI